MNWDWLTFMAFAYRLLRLGCVMCRGPKGDAAHCTCKGTYGSVETLCERFGEKQLKVLHDVAEDLLGAEYRCNDVSAWHAALLGPRE